MPAELSLHVVGAAHPNKDGGNRLFEILLCAPGEPVQLVPEPKNPADPNAIMVLSSRGVCIGYVAAERALLIGSKMRAGADVAAVFQEKTAAGAAIRVNFEGAKPSVPAAATAPPSTPISGDTVRTQSGADPDSGFWPDPEWPDD